jgi:hypothetical protein
MFQQKREKWRRKNKTTDLKSLRSMMLRSWRRKSKIKKGKRVSPGERTEDGSLVAQGKKRSVTGCGVDKYQPVYIFSVYSLLSGFLLSTSFFSSVLEGNPVVLRFYFGVLVATDIGRR